MACTGSGFGVCVLYSCCSLLNKWSWVMALIYQIAKNKVTVYVSLTTGNSLISTSSTSRALWFLLYGKGMSALASGKCLQLPPDCRRVTAGLTFVHKSMQIRHPSMIMKHGSVSIRKGLLSWIYQALQELSSSTQRASKRWSQRRIQCRKWAWL